MIYNSKEIKTTKTLKFLIKFILSIYIFYRFIDKESAIKAEAENGLLFEEHHLRVHSCMSSEKPDETKAIFVGNLSFSKYYYFI